MPNPDQPTNKRIKTARKSRGMSQTKFATQMKCSQATISAYESGETSPTAAWLIRAAAVLDVSPRELMPRA